MQVAPVPAGAEGNACKYYCSNQGTYRFCRLHLFERRRIHRWLARRLAEGARDNFIVTLDYDEPPEPRSEEPERDVKERVCCEAADACVKM